VRLTRLGIRPAPQRRRPDRLHLLSAESLGVPLSLILHATTRAAWIDGAAAGAFTAPSLAAEGFIHCSTPGQLERVARAFPRLDELVLLCVDETRVRAEIRYEGSHEGGERFPHVYGPIDLDAVVDVVALPADAAGRYVLPSEIALLERRYSTRSSSSS
jgi:uncharacterized protein (DUF952 family)